MTPEDSPYYCKYCKRVISVAFKLHMKDKHGMGVIELKNGSTIWVTTDKSEYKHVTGKSMKHFRLDE